MRFRVLAVAIALAAVPTQTAEAKLKPTRQVLTVGNNWDGTADLVDPRRFTRLTRINVVPDLAERMAEIQADPVRYGYFLAIRQEIGEGHDQLVDDAFTSLDGRYLYVSRPSLADVVAISLKTHQIVWRTRVEGNRSDHMALSPDGTRLLVLKRIKMGDKLAEAGYPNMSSAVRPMTLAPGGKIVYFQLSFLHGFVEYDLVNDKVLRVAQLPLSDEAAAKRRDEYLLDSAHHGLAINPQATKLCVAGTMSDYAAIVDRATFAARILPLGHKPYWATNSADGRYCFVSFSGDDRVSAISYASEREIAASPSAITRSGCGWA